MSSEATRVVGPCNDDSRTRLKTPAVSDDIVIWNLSS